MLAPGQFPLTLGVSMFGMFVFVVLCAVIGPAIYAVLVRYWPAKRPLCLALTVPATLFVSAFGFLLMLALVARDHGIIR
jgi:hypothetical protein